MVVGKRQAAKHDPLSHFPAAVHTHTWRLVYKRFRMRMVMGHRYRQKSLVMLYSVGFRLEHNTTFDAIEVAFGHSIAQFVDESGSFGD